MKDVQKVLCLSWLDQPNRRFLTSLSSFLEQEAELQVNLNHYV